MSRKLSRETIREQIQDDGEDFGIVPMDTVFGTVIAAEEILTVIPLLPGINCIEPVERDITSISMEYPLARVIGSRKKKHERSFAHRAELAHMAEQRAIEIRKEAIYHELESDIRKADRGRIVLPTVR